MVDTITTLHLPPSGDVPARKIKLRIAFPREKVIVLRAHKPSSWGIELMPSMAELICTQLVLRFALDPEKTTFIYERMEGEASQYMKLGFDIDADPANPMLRNCHSAWLEPDLEKEIRGILEGNIIPRRRWDPRRLRRQENNRSLLIGLGLGAFLVVAIMPFLEMRLAQVAQELNKNITPSVTTDPEVDARIEAKLDKLNQGVERLAHTPTIQTSMPVPAPTQASTPPPAPQDNPNLNLNLNADNAVQTNTTDNPGIPSPSGSGEQSQLPTPAPLPQRAQTPPAQQPLPDSQTTEVDGGSGAPTVITVEPSSSRPMNVKPIPAKPVPAQRP